MGRVGPTGSYQINLKTIGTAFFYPHYMRRTLVCRCIYTYCHVPVKATAKLVSSRAAETRSEMTYADLHKSILE